MMPTYAYRCEACDFEFEKFQAITANALRKCPECGKLKLRRLLGTGAGILFKGGGFYQTDYRSDSYKEAAKKDKPATDKTDKTDKKESSKKKDGADKSKTNQTDKKKTA